MSVRQVVRRFSTTVKKGSASLRDPIDANAARGVVPDNPTYQRLMKIQEAWTKDTEKLVWQKRPVDTYLFYSSLALMTVGLAYVGYRVAGFLYPAKKN